MGGKRTPECVGDFFPFTSFFDDAPQPLFRAQSYEEDWEKAKVCKGAVRQTLGLPWRQARLPQQSQVSLLVTRH